MDASLKRPLEEEHDSVSECSEEKQMCLDPAVSSVDEIESDDVSKNREEEFGIIEYLGTNEGFYGVIKQSWEDFHVHEIDKLGEVVHLTSTDVPCLPGEKDPEPVSEEKVYTPDLSQDLQEVIAEFCTSNETLLRLPASEDKEARELFHKSMKAHFSQLDSSTESQQGVREYVLRKCVNKRTADKVANARRGRLSGKNHNKYCTFTLYKEGKDTMNATTLIARMLQLHPKCVTFAGNKDKRAITVQRCSIRGMNAERLAKLNGQLRGMKLGNFTYTDQPVHLADLTGNRFTIVIRDVAVSDNTAVIDHAIDQLKQFGFINYFGTQRFGTSKISTKDVGIALLKKDWKTAIQLILTPTPEDLPAVRTFKEKYCNSDVIDSNIHKMPISIEKSLLYGIQQHGRTLLALRVLPRQTLQLYVHSVQSYLWNRVVSQRVRAHQLAVFPGDLVYTNTSQPDSFSVQEVSEANLANYSIYDVLMPLPGSSVRYPTCHEVKECFVKELQLLDLTLESMNSKEFHLTGAYRHMLCKAAALEYSLCKYDNPSLSLVATDVQIMEQEAPAVLPGNDGSKQAVVVSFNLPKAAYATMALRQLMRTARLCK